MPLAPRLASLDEVCGARRSTQDPLGDRGMNVGLQVTNDDRRYSVTLRLRGDLLNLDEAREYLGPYSVQICRKGEHIRGNPQSATYETNLCLLSFGESNSEPWEPRLVRLLEVVEPLVAWLDELRAAAVVIEVYLGYTSKSGQGGGSISSATVSRISRLGLSVELHV